MLILFGGEWRLWALRGSRATYGLAVEEEGSLRHFYFSPPLSRLGTQSARMSSPLGRDRFSLGSRPRTTMNLEVQFVALEEVAGSIPLGHPRVFRRNAAFS